LITGLSGVPAGEAVVLGEWWAKKRARQLKRFGDAEKQSVIHDGADELQTHGQAFARSAARYGDSRKPPEIRRAVVAQE
jgi:uncharacterized lipoprotein YmbA